MRSVSEEDAGKTAAACADPGAGVAAFAACDDGVSRAGRHRKGRRDPAAGAALPDVAAAACAPNIYRDGGDAFRNCPGLRAARVVKTVHDRERTVERTVHCFSIIRGGGKRVDGEICAAGAAAEAGAAARLRVPFDVVAEGRGGQVGGFTAINRSRVGGDAGGRIGWVNGDGETARGGGECIGHGGVSDGEICAARQSCRTVGHEVEVAIVELDEEIAVSAAQFVVPLAAAAGVDFRVILVVQVVRFAARPVDEGHGVAVRPNEIAFLRHVVETDEVVLPELVDVRVDIGVFRRTVDGDEVAAQRLGCIFGLNPGVFEVRAEVVVPLESAHE